MKREKGPVGRPRRAEPYGKISFTISKNICKELDRQCAEFRMTRSDLVGMCVREYFNSTPTEECDNLRKKLVEIRATIER